MDNIHKKTLVGLQVEKAKRFLAQADEMVELKHWDLAAAIIMPVFMLCKHFL